MSEGQHPTSLAIGNGQLEQLRSLLAELIPANPFYTSKLSSAGVGYDVASLEDFSRRFPFTTKSELLQDQRRHAPFGSNLTYPIHCYTRFHQTSGTSGVPMRWLDTPESWDWMLVNWEQIFLAAGVTAKDRIYFAFSFGPFIGFWIAYEAAGRIGAMCLPGGGLSSVARLNAIIENGATVLCCTPTYALRLAEVAGTEGIDLHRSKISKLIVAGEPGGSVPATRARLEKLWPGARTFDHHGMTETGPVTYECPLRPGTLHVMESGFIAEIIESSGERAVKTGETGELVLTTLGRTGSPLLRYRTGDLVRAETKQTCSCGSNETTLIGGILGRCDDMMVVRGVNLFPAAVEEIILSCPGIQEYQVRVSTVRSLTELDVQIEPTTSHSGHLNGLSAELEKAFQDRLHLRIPVTMVPAGTLPRYEMKARRWVRETS